MRNDVFLSLEGGALRGVYTAGVLDVFMEEGLWFPNVAGVSAGAMNALNYLARQHGRSARVNFGYVNDPRYMGARHLLRGHSYFNFNFLFVELSQKLEPFDYQTFESATERLYAVATDCRTGEPVFFEKDACDDIYLAVQASASLPLMGNITTVDGYPCLDGGVSTPVPVGDDLPGVPGKNVVVLTRQKGYRKRPMTAAMVLACRQQYEKEYPHLVEAMRTVHERYNAQMKRIERLEREEKIFVIRPTTPVQVSRTERNVQKLAALYSQGKREARDKLPALRAYLELPPADQIPEEFPPEP